MDAFSWSAGDLVFSLVRVTTTKTAGGCPQESHRDDELTNNNNSSNQHNMFSSDAFVLDLGEEYAVRTKIRPATSRHRQSHP
jgi:hypothetical protein